MNVALVSAWLVHGCEFLLPDRKRVRISQRSGWVRTDSGRRFIQPGLSDVESYTDVRAATGTKEGWLKGVELVHAMGEHGYAALALIGHALAAPAVELTGKRNGVIGVVQKSSVGKTTVAQYAISAFGHVDELNFDANNMTICGFQDRVHERQGLPLLIDDMHNLLDDPTQPITRLAYQMANGRRRVTSSKEKVSFGGERHYGSFIYTSEGRIADALQTGALYRMIEIETPLLQHREQAAKLQAITRANAGAMAEEVIATINAEADTLPNTIEDLAAFISQVEPGLKGDDAYVIAHVQYGLKILEEISGIPLPDERVAMWLADNVARLRRTGEDKPTTAFRVVLEYVGNVEWGLIGNDAPAMVGAAPLAWRRPNGDIDVNPQHEKIRELLRAFGGERFAKEWAKRGWLLTQGDGNPKVKVNRNGFVLRAWRIPAAVAMGGDAPTLD